jgi:NAD(P)-dependent dehydrogenase (short-subunit alcohol dehydrogenase family)
VSQPRVALVTGASSGIGDAIARQLATAGFRVFGASRRTPATVVSGSERVTIDVDDDASVRAGVATVLQEAGRIDVLVNGAGYLCAGAVEETSLADAKAQFETNYFGVVRMTLEVLPGMRERMFGHIITISSLAGLVPVPFWGQYNASKFAVEGLMETLRHEVRPFGIQVAMVEAGAIKTALYALPPAVGIGAYAGPRRRGLGVMAEFVRKAPGPEVMGRKVVAIANDAHPKLRNTVTREATQFTLLKWLLPQSAFESGVRRGFKLVGKDDEAQPERSRQDA